MSTRLVTRSRTRIRLGIRLMEHVFGLIVRVLLECVAQIVCEESEAANLAICLMYC